MSALLSKMSNSKGEYKNVPVSEKKDDPPAYAAPRGIGTRHVQMFILFLSISIGFTIKTHLSVAMVAMTSIDESCERNSTNGSKSITTECNQDKTWSVYQVTSPNCTECDVIEDAYHVMMECIRNEDARRDLTCKNEALLEVGGCNQILADPLSDDIKGLIKTYEWTKKEQEMMLFSFFVGYTPMMLPMGIVAQKYGGKIPVLVGLAVNGVTSIITPWIPIFGGWVGVCIMRLLQGITQAAFFPGIHTMLGKWAPVSERGRLSTYVYTGSQFGTIVAFQISGFFCGSPVFGWPSSFWLWGGLSLACFFLLARFGSASPHEHKTISPEELAFITGESAAETVPKKRPTPWKHILTSRAVLVLILTQSGAAVGFLFILTQLPLYMHKILGVDIKTNGLLSSLPYISMYFMALFFGNLTDFLKNHNYMSLINIRRFSNTVGMVLSSVFLLGMCYVTTTWLAVTLLVISMGLSSGIYTGVLLNQLDLAPNFAGPMMGLGNMIANLSGLSVPFLVYGILGDDLTNHHKWQMAFIVVVALQVVANTIFVAFVRVDLQHWNFYGDENNEEYETKDLCVMKDNSVVIKTSLSSLS